MRPTTLTRAAEPAAASRDCAPPPTSNAIFGRSPRLASGGWAIVAAIAAATLIGAGLRLWGAESPLWLDEIWSLDNLAGLSHGWQVFWRISHDNNHFLNSLWLFWASGGSHNPLLLRAPSIALGAALIPVMAAILWRRGAAAAVIAALLTAFSYFFVSYSAEARGYAGEALALAAAYRCLELAMADPLSRARFGLAAAAGLGMFWHLATLPALILLGVACLAELRRREGRWDAGLHGAFRLFAPVGLAVLPALACLAAGILVTGKFTIGGLRPFAYGPAFAATAAAAGETLGLPEAFPTLATLAGAAAALALGLGLRLVAEERRIVYAVFLLGAPAAVLLSRPANAHIARYYLPCALFLILFAAEAAGTLWRQGGWRRWAAALAIAVSLGGGAAALIARQASLDAAWPQALATIEASGKLIVASSADERTARLIGEFDRTHAPPIALAPRPDWCAKRPDWLLAEPASVVGDPPQIEIGPCRLRFVFVGAYAGGGLTAVDWLLYRRAPDEDAR